MVAADINVANIHKRRHNQSECPRGNNRGRLTTKGSNEEQWKSRKTKRGLCHWKTKMILKIVIWHILKLRTKSETKIQEKL